MWKEDLMYDTIFDVMENRKCNNLLQGNVYIWDIVKEVQEIILENGQENARYRRALYYDDEIDEKGQPIVYSESDYSEDDYSEVESDPILEHEIYEEIKRELKILKKQAQEDEQDVEIERDFKIMNNIDEYNDEYDDDEEDNEEEFEGYEDDEDEEMNEENEEEYEPEMEGEEVNSQKRNREEYGDWADFGKPAKSKKLINIKK